MFLGEFAALGTAVLWSLTAVFFSISGRIIGSTVVNRSRLLFAFFFLLLTHWLLEGSLFPWDAEPYRWFWLSLSSILGLVVGDTFLFQAYVMIGPRLSMLLLATVPIFSVLFGRLFFGEVISGVEMAGVLLAVFGIAWVVTEKRPGQTDGEKRLYKFGIFFGLLGALGQVANLVTARYGLVGGYSTMSATVIRIFVAVLVMWGIAVFRGQVRHTFRQWGNRQALPALIGGTIAGPFLGIWLSLVAIQNARLGIAATLMALSPILLIPIEWILFRQNVSARGVLGTAVAISGVAMIFL